MARLLAIEWDSGEARVVSARQRGGDVTFEKAFCVDLSAQHAEDDARREPGELIAAALSANGVSRGEVLAAVGRASIELRVLKVPPAPDDELPDMVRFQASSQFSTMGEDWPLDFVKLAKTGDDQPVLAATVSPKLMKQVHATCNAAGLKPQRVLLRPYAGASLIGRNYNDDRCRLVVDMLGEEADLTVIADKQVALMRTVRIPAGDASTRIIVGEIRRTMASALNQLAGRAVEQVVICGADEHHKKLKEAAASAFDLEVEMLDPFSVVTLGEELKRRLPEHHGRFAPLLGLLLDEAGSASHAIDFMAPRRRKDPPDPKWKWILGGGVAAAVLLAIGFVFYSTGASYDREIARLEEQVASMKKGKEKSEEIIARAATVDEWKASDIVWLEEMKDISERFPPPEDAIITQLIAGTASKGGGRMFLDGSVRESEVIGKLEDSLAAGTRTVESAGGRPDTASPNYAVKFKETVTFAPLEPEEITSPAAEEPPAKDASEDKAAATADDGSEKGASS